MQSAARMFIDVRYDLCHVLHSPTLVFAGLWRAGDATFTRGRSVYFGRCRMKLSRFVKFREEKFGGVLFETRSEKVFTLNATAAAVVREIQAGRDEPEIARRLQDLF